MPDEDVDEGDDGSRFSAAGCHDEEGFSSVFRVKCPANSFYGLHLIVAAGDGVVDLDVGERCSECEFGKLFFEVTFCVDAGDFSFRVFGVVPDPGFKAVGEEDDRPFAEFLFEEVGVEFCLLTSDCGVFAGLFRFDEGEGSAVVSEEDIVGVSNSAAVRHPCEFVFIEPVFAFFPACVDELGVDVDFAGFVF